jgi:hypothetical protein
MFIQKGCTVVVGSLTFEGLSNPWRCGSTSKFVGVPFDLLSRVPHRAQSLTLAVDHERLLQFQDMLHHPLPGKDGICILSLGRPPEWSISSGGPIRTAAGCQIDRQEGPTQLCCMLSNQVGKNMRQFDGMIVLVYPVAWSAILDPIAR